MLKYTHIANDIRNQILRGELRPNDQLPLVQQMQGIYDSSKMTIKKALDILESEGLIVKKRGSGTFVKNMTKQTMEHLLVSSQLRGATAVYSDRNVHSKVLKFDVIPAGSQVGSQLAISPEDFVYYIVRVRYVDDTALSVETNYMPINLIPQLHQKHAEGSLYAYIQDTLGLKIQSAHRTIRVRLSTALEQSELKIDEGAPVAIVEQTAYLDDGCPFAYSCSAHEAEHFAFETVIVM